MKDPFRTPAAALIVISIFLLGSGLACSLTIDTGGTPTSTPTPPPTSTIPSPTSIPPTETVIPPTNTPVPTPTLPPTPISLPAQISGMVWHDLCALKDGQPPSSGCVWISDTTGYEANGWFDAGEPGIGGVILLLGAGTCPADTLRSTATGSSGYFQFTNLEPGRYCLSVSSLENGNDSILIPGGWTYPLRGEDPQSVNITLASGESRSDMYFGWDFQFLP